ARRRRWWNAACRHTSIWATWRRSSATPGWRRSATRAWSRSTRSTWRRSASCASWAQGAEPRLLRQHDLGLFLACPVEQRRAPEDLRHLRAGLLRQPLRPLVPILWGALADAHLDQLVRLELLMRLSHHCFGDSFVPDLHHRLEVVPQRAQMAPLPAGERVSQRWPEPRTRDPGGSPSAAPRGRRAAAGRGTRWESRPRCLRRTRGTSRA